MAAKKTSKKPSSKKKPATKDMTSLVDLTPEAVKALQRPREKFEEHVESLFTLYADHAGTLGALNVDVDEARARLARYSELLPDEDKARAEAEAANKKLEMVLETRGLQAHTVWSVMLDIYGRAKQAGKKDAQIAAAIKPFAKFMSTGPRQKASAAGK
jgi:hypothetical protein